MGNQKAARRTFDGDAEIEMRIIGAALTRMIARALIAEGARAWRAKTEAQAERAADAWAIERTLRDLGEHGGTRREYSWSSAPLVCNDMVVLGESTSDAWVRQKNRVR